MEFFWLLMSGLNAAIAPSAIVGSAVGGIIGNRVDAALVGATVKLWRKGDRVTNETLERSVQKAWLVAQISLAQDCLEELQGKDQAQIFRGMTVYKQFPNEIKWLEESLRSWGRELKTIDRATMSLTFSLDGLEEVEALLGVEGRSAEQMQQVMREKLWAGIAGDAPQIDLTRAKGSGRGLWERFGEAFAGELQGNGAVAQIFESQILAQINAGVRDQQVMLKDLMIVTAMGIQEILQKLEEGRLSGGMVAAVAPSLVVVGGVAVRLPNPFFPLSGRMDDASQFFPRSRLVDRVFELLNSGSSVALIGAAESGKSSVLREIERSVASRTAGGVFGFESGEWG